MNPWDKAAKRLLHRPDSLLEPGMLMGALSGTTPFHSPDTSTCKLERGVNYFVLALERMGATTFWSCEGHPTGFYIMFAADYPLALKIERAGFFRVELSKRKNCFVIRLGAQSARTERMKRECLRYAAKAWEKMMERMKVP